AKILRHQHDDGGFGLWIGAPAEMHYTAYGLWGLELARSGGFDVDPEALARRTAYLKAHLAEAPAGGQSAAEIADEGGSRAFAHYVLAVLEHAQKNELTQLYERRAELPLFAQSALARARSAGTATVTVSVAGKTRLRRTLSGDAVARLRVPLAEAGPLVIDSAGGELFYAARLEVEQPLGDGALDRGLALERVYLDPDSGQPLTRIRLGQLVKVRLS